MRRLTKEEQQEYNRLCAKVRELSETFDRLDEANLDTDEVAIELEKILDQCSSLIQRKTKILSYVKNIWQDSGCSSLNVL